MTKLHRTKRFSGDVADYGVTYTIADGENQAGETFTTRHWQLFMPVIDPVGEGRDESVVQAEFEAAKKTAIERLAQFDEWTNGRGPRLLVEGDNKVMGDSIAAPDLVTPITTLREKYESVLDGSWSVRGGTADIEEETYRELVAKHVRKAGGLNKTKAAALVKDSLAKAEALVARKAGMPVAAYREKTRKTAQESLEF